MPLPTPSTIPQLTPHVGPVPPDALLEISKNPGSVSVRADQFLPGHIGGATLRKDGGLSGSGFWSTAAITCIAGSAFNPNSVSGAAIYYPFLAGRTALLHDIGVLQNSAGGSAGKLLRVGLYTATSDVDPYPADLIVDSGNISVDDSMTVYTILSYALPTPRTLLQGHWYWLAFQANAVLTAANIQAVPGITESAIMSPLGRSLLNAFHGTFGMATGFPLTRAYGAFEAVFPAGKEPAGSGHYNLPDGNFMPSILPEILMHFTA